MNFNSLQNTRKDFLRANKCNDYVFTVGNNNILLSAPHGVSQIRLGKYKTREIGSLTTLLYLKDNTNCHTIAKTKNNNDDANFDEQSPYKNKIEQIIKTHKIMYVIDIHGLSEKRECDINLGTHLGKNINNNTALFDRLYNSLIDNGFIVSIDQPFMGGARTISGSIISKNPELWTLQIEINCSITNKIENFKRFKALLQILTNWLNSIDNVY